MNGSTNITASQTSSMTRPIRAVNITRVRINVVGATTTTVGLTVGSLFDTNSNPISPTATGCMVMVNGGAATTTSTTSTTSSTTTTQPATSTTTSTTSTTTTQPSITTTTSSTTTTITGNPCPLGQGV